MIVGFDFGTTNSLVSVVVGDRVIDVMDVETGRPTQAQLLERLYYQSCAVCKRQWGNPECRCGSA